jgi:gluconolactonase
LWLGIERQMALYSTSDTQAPPLGIVKDDEMAAEIRAMPLSERGATGYCDGVVMDRNGRLYVTLPFANRIVSVDCTGRLSTLIHDPAGARIDFPTNLAWGGPDLRDLYVVSRGSGSIVRAGMEVPGLPAANWPL